MDFPALLRQGSEMPQRRFGMYLKRLLDDRNLSQEYFAEATNLAEGSVSQLITGKGRPKLAWIPRWCAVLNLSTEECDRLGNLAKLARAPTEVELEVLELKRQLGQDDLEIPKDHLPPT